MTKAHEVEEVLFVGTALRMRVDGVEHEVDIRRCSKRLTAATPEQRAKFEVSPSGYGIHWPDLDEDLSIDGLIGIEHSSPLVKAQQ